tara:strand:- start:47 stop:580 length:534 start_codon:yes stop_codon:yes gene_type:complete
MSIIKKNSSKFFKINLLLIVIVFFLFSKVYLNAAENRAILSVGNQDAKVTIKVFSSLTCPHCANFHNKIFQKLKKEFIDKNKVKYEHHGFPLDLAALNAEKILGCVESKDKKIKLLNDLYKSQDIWASGSDINSINDKLFKISNNFGLNNDKNNSCLNDQNLEDEILNERINATKNY